MNTVPRIAAAFAALALPYALSLPVNAQQHLAGPWQPTAGSAVCQTLSGSVRDSTQALIPGAALLLDQTQTVKSGPDGGFRFSCLSPGQHRLTVSAEGFASRDVPVRLNRSGSLDIVLEPATTETLDVNADDSAAADSPDQAGPAQTISGSRLATLADDPDDLQRELQQLAAAGGGSPSNTTIAVDGYQGSSALPPKSSIAYIKVNPDQFSAEYQQPPFEGGRIEIYTKPGAKAFHGALFLTNGSPFENARDPFSTSSEAIGKQRYGLELTGPIRKQGSDFSLTLEHRSIDNDAVVDAFLPSGSFTQNVPDPQRLWLGTARVDWQLGAKNTLISSYSANVNHLVNVGVGGSSLAETGYDSLKYEHMFRISDITSASAHLMHESRLSLRWDGQNNNPNSTAPSVSVSGAFNGGGASIGPQQIHELNTEWDDDFIYTTAQHTLKAGSQLMVYNEHRRLTNGFNGALIYANLQQYAANSATEYSVVTGTPAVDFTQVQESLFAQDDFKLSHGVQLSYGARYSMATQPTRLDGFTPRFGILWSPTKQGTWTLHGHIGMFTGGLGASTTAEILREDGTHRVTSLIYNPNPANPFLNATPVQSIRRYAPGFGHTLFYAANSGGTRTLPHGWNLSLDYYFGRLWNDDRTLNINAPLNGQPNGLRPYAPNLNILETQNSGQGRVNATFAGIENHTYKRVQFFVGAVRVKLTDDTDDNPLASPQSTYSNVGEFAPRSGQSTWNAFGNASINLPAKLALSFNLNANGDAHYNIITGFDNNGDGNFNDRPQYALSASQPGAIATPWGLLVASGGSGVFSRNKGTMPWDVYVDGNLQRAFKLTRNAKAEHQQTLTLNLRSSNLLNHLNATSVDGVLGSPQFLQPYAADPGRRIEAGARYSF